MTKHHAQCQCGQLQVTADADPDFVIACNCKACQRRTGSAFGTGAYFRKENLNVSGEWNAWNRKADSGREIGNRFCPNCGTNVLWSLDMRPDHMGVSYGCFDGPVPDPIRAIWTEEQHDWVHFPEDWPTYAKGSPS